MLTPIVCMTCGMPLDDKADLFRAMRAAQYKTLLAERGTLVTEAAAEAGLQADCEAILTALVIEEDCCRTHMVTAMEFSDYY